MAFFYAKMHFKVVNKNFIFILAIAANRFVNVFRRVCAFDAEDFAGDGCMYK